MAASKLPLDHASFGLIRRLVREHVRGHFKTLAAAVACMLVVASANGLSAWLMDPVVNKVFVQHDAAMLYPVGLAVLAAALAKGLGAYGQAVLMNKVGQRIIATVQKRMYDHLIGMDLAFFQSRATGTLVSRFTYDVQAIRGAVSTVLTGIGRDTLSVIFLVGVMFYQDWLLALVSFVVFPAAVLPIRRLGRRMRKVSTNTQVHVGELTTILEQTFQGVRHVKAYGMENYERSRVGALVEKIFQLTYKAAKVRSASSPIMETFGGIAITVIIIYGGQRVLHGATTPGQFFSFITALLMAYQPMKSLANLNTSMQEGLAAAHRIFTLLDTPALIQERADARKLDLKGGEVRFENVSFSYVDDRQALKDLSLVVPAGKTVALVGPSGGGKSTILNLIPRFYDVAQGRVLIDGQDVRDLDFASLRASIALVSQEISLFDDTVHANIAYGRWDAREDEVVEAARAAAAWDFITALPEGFRSLVGEHGVRLSGGQRQRLAIARAMLKNAPILLLDEATSALDTESERQVQAALKTLMQGRTTLVIAHRLSTIVDADLIYVIDGGRIVESGTHTQLLARDGAYARLYALQFADESRQQAAVAAG